MEKRKIRNDDIVVKVTREKYWVKSFNNSEVRNV